MKTYIEIIIEESTKDENFKIENSLLIMLRWNLSDANVFLRKWRALDDFRSVYIFYVPK